MSDTATGNQVPTGGTATGTPAATETGEQTTTALDAALESDIGGTLDANYTAEDSPAEVGAHEGETAREVAAQHFARLMYAPQSTWSRYVFHENDPHPFGSSRERRSRG